MPAQIYVRDDRKKYDVRDKDCLGRTCLRLYPIDIRGATSYGSRSTGRKAYECSCRYHFGCPRVLPEFDKNLARERRKEGMRLR